MHEAVDRVSRQISEKGGSLSADALQLLFQDCGQEFGESFSVGKLVEDFYGRQFGDPRGYRVNDTASLPEHGSNVGASGFNVLPSPPGPGACAQLCMTFVGDDFRSIHPNPRVGVG